MALAVTGRTSAGRLQRWRGRRGFGLVMVGVVVLVAAFASSASAGVLITGRQIKDGTITRADVRDGTVAGRDVRDKSLTPADFTGSLEGPPGAQGAQGAPGTAGVSGIEFNTASMTVDPLSAGTAGSVGCSAGKAAIGGGFSNDEFVDALQLQESAPATDEAGNVTGWGVVVANVSSQRVTAFVWSVCALTR